MRHCSIEFSIESWAWMQELQYLGGGAKERRSSDLQSATRGKVIVDGPGMDVKLQQIYTQGNSGEDQSSRFG